MKKRFGLIALMMCTLLSGCSEKKMESIAENETFYATDTSVDGTLKYQVVSSSCYRNIFDAGIAYEDIHELNDLVNSENGDMLEGSIFVLVDLNIENVDAIPTEDVRFFDDITFRVDDLNLADVSEKFSDENYAYRYVCYFSESGKCDEHFVAYELPQGEALNCQLGYITFDDNVEDLYLCNTSGNVSGTFVDLNLQLEESE